MKRVKLTPFAKVLILALVLGIVGFAVVKTGAINDVKNLISGNKSNQNSDDLYVEAEKIKKEDGVINISLDEWVGWKPIIDANGGLTTQKDSIYDKLGIKVNLSIINDATQSSNALIKGDLHGAGYTVNRYAFLYPKFEENKVPVKMAYINNSSAGGDGIIAKDGINSVEDLVGKVIGVPKFSEAQTLVEWLLAKSSLNEEQIKSIRDNMILFDTPDDTAKAFFAGELDAAATWQPYLSQAEESTNSKILFSTKNATSIILDGIVFREDFLNSNKEIVQKFVEGALMAEELYETEFKSIKNTFPMFATESNDNIKAMTGDAMLTNCSSNIEMLINNGTASSLFKDMSNVWLSIGENANPDSANNAFDSSIVESLKDKFPEEQKQSISFTEEQREAAQTIDNMKSLMSQKITIEFAPDSAVIVPESYPVLDEFVGTAQVLNGTIIQIEGNVALVGTDNPLDEASMKLSEQRAKSVANYLINKGVDPTRFVIVGNGASKPVGDNSTEEGKRLNRRTDVYFKVIE